MPWLRHRNLRGIHIHDSPCPDLWNSYEGFFHGKTISPIFSCAPLYAGLLKLRGYDLFNHKEPRNRYDSWNRNLPILHYGLPNDSFLPRRYMVGPMPECRATVVQRTITVGTETVIARETTTEHCEEIYMEWYEEKQKWEKG